MQSTSLDEIIFLACLIGAAYHLARWTRNNSYADLLWAGLATFLGTLTRYDGWSLFIAAVVVVLVWTKLHDRRLHAGQANVIFYGFIGGYGILLWFLYNWIIFGSALYFINSTYSAQTQQLYQEQIGLLPTKYHLGTTLATFGWGILDVASLAVVAAGFLGVLLLLIRRHRLRNLAILSLLSAPILMNLIMLFIGQTTMRVPQMPLQQIFNLRYALEALPLLAVGAASLAVYLKGKMAILPLGAAAYALVAMVLASPITLSEGQYGVSSYASHQATAAATFLVANYRGGEILADDGQASPLIFRTGFNLSSFVTPGFHPNWEQALLNPRQEVSWIIVYQRDAVDNDLVAHPGRFTDYLVVFTDPPSPFTSLNHEAALDKSDTPFGGGAGAVGLHPRRSQWCWVKRTPSLSATPTAAATATTTVIATPTPTPVPTPVALPAYQAGVNLLFYANSGWEQEMSALLAELHRDNVNSISLTFPVYQAGPTSTQVTQGSGTPPDTQLEGVVSALEMDGFSVMLRPLMNEGNLAPDWRGTITPSSDAAWFTSYTALMVHYATIAQNLDVQVFDVGSEFYSLEGDTAGWEQVIAAVRQVYFGKVTYSVNGNSETGDGFLDGFWSVLDYISVDAYWDLGVANNATAAQLAAAWQPYLTQMATAAAGKPVVLQRGWHHTPRWRAEPTLGGRADRGAHQHGLPGDLLPGSVSGSGSGPPGRPILVGGQYRNAG